MTFENAGNYRLELIPPINIITGGLGFVVSTLLLALAICVIPFALVYVPIAYSCGATDPLAFFKALPPLLVAVLLNVIRMIPILGPLVLLATIEQRTGWAVANEVCSVDPSDVSGYRFFYMV